MLSKNGSWFSRCFLSSFSVVFVGMAAANCPAQFWFDDFNDDDFMDASPVTWSVNPASALPGEYTSNDGDFVMFAQNAEDDNESMAAWVDDVDFVGSASVRTRASIFEIPDITEPAGNVGALLFFDPDTISGYLGLMSVDTNLQLIAVQGGAAEGLMNVNLDTFAPDEDIYLQLDHDGQFLSLTAWPVTESQPDPQIIFEDSRYETGKSGIIFNENSPNGAGIFRNARAQSIPILDGDINIDGQIDAADIDELVRNLDSTEVIYDFTENGTVDSEDVSALLSKVFQSQPGDANLDGSVNQSDLDIWSANRFTENASWETGDFNGDQVTDGSDFNILLNARSAAPAAVPEPATATMLLLMAAAMLVRTR